jgi:putative hemolysin
MTHRTDVFSLNAESNLEAALPQVLDSGYAQIPVWRDNKENIVGVIHEKYLLRSLCGQQDGLHLYEIMEPPVFVGENWNVQRVFQRLKHQKASMGIVIDEYGGLSGIVTLNDLVSQIVGDLDEENLGFKERIVVNPDGSWQIPGEETLFHLEELAGIEVQEARTGMNVAAYLEGLIARIPEAGEKIDTPLGAMRIRQIQGMCIETVDFYPNKKFDNNK